MSRAILFITASILLTALFFRLKVIKQPTKNTTLQNVMEVKKKQMTTPLVSPTQTVVPTLANTLPTQNVLSPTTGSLATATSSSNFTLTLSSPQNNSTSAKSSVLVSGTTAPHAQVFINEYDMKADTTGRFSKEIPLEEGENIITVLAHDEKGNDAETEITVIYESGKYE